MIYHVVNTYQPKSKEECARNDFAKSTWSLPLICIEDKHLKRSSLDIGDTRFVPFVKDLFDIAIAKKNVEDIIIFTNTDICLVSDIQAYVNDDQLKNDCYYAARNEFTADLDHSLNQEEVKQLLMHTVLGGGDLFVFRVKWWVTNRDKYPDMLLGCQWWDTILQDLMDQSCDEKPILRNIIYHRSHHSFWYRGNNKTENKGQIHNFNIANKLGYTTRNNILDVHYKTFYIADRVTRMVKKQIIL